MSGATIHLDQLLMLVGELTDQNGKDTSRDRFRQFLESSVLSLGTVRDYVNVCLTKSGTQYNRALQDLVNHTGRLMGFEVEFGRYAGVTNDIGHDGLWKADNFTIVVEVKTTDVFSVMTSTLLGYINSLIDAGKIPNLESALGLYVFGKPDADLQQLEGAIVHGGHSQRLRIATVDDILSLADLVQENLLSRDEVLDLLKPAGVKVGSTVQLLKRVAGSMPPTANRKLPEPDPKSSPLEEGQEPSYVVKTTKEAKKQATTEPRYLLTPVASETDVTAEETIRSLLDHKVYVFGDKTPGRKKLKPGDMLAFYEAGKGVVASAKVTSKPEQTKVTFARHAEKFPWSFQVTDVKYFFDNPVLIDAEVRSKLDAFQSHNPLGPWSWFVQSTHYLTEHDFKVLTNLV